MVSDSHFGKPFKGQPGAASLGNFNVPQEVVEIAERLLAQLDAENPKSDEYVALETAKNDRLSQNLADTDKIEAERALLARMDRSDSYL